MKRNQNVTRFHSQHAPIKHSNGTRMTMMMIIRMCNEVVCAELYLAAWAGLCHKGKGIAMCLVLLFVAMKNSCKIIIYAFIISRLIDTKPPTRPREAYTRQPATGISANHELMNT